MPRVKRAMTSGVPRLTWSATHSSSSVIVQVTELPATSEAMSSNVGASSAVMVVGPSYAPFEARIAAAAAAASSRAVHETGPSSGTPVT
jgi:ABC-type methionine transport system permease subunit